MKKFIKLLIVLCLMSLTFGCAGEDIYVAGDMEDSTLHDAEDGGVNTETEESGQICVYVCGFVNKPGVYALDRDARVCDALEMAGGVDEDGAEESLNQAEHISDGQTIYVPSIDEVSERGTEEADDGLIDINKASKEELLTLPGIGASKADAIIAYRSEHGSFESPEDVMNIPGIKAGVFEKIKSFIKVR